MISHLGITLAGVTGLGDLALFVTRAILTGFISKLPLVVAAYDGVTPDAIDPYIAVRDGYLSHRAAEIKK